jgi:hypothetical protein
MSRVRFASLIVASGFWSAALLAQSASPPVQTPVPKPFPGARASGESGSPDVQPQVAAGEDAGRLDPRLTGVPLYPGAEFLQTFDAGLDQTMWSFGTNDSFAAIVAYYKGQFRKSGDEVSKTPAIQQFDLGSFDSRTMAQRPSVIVKDFTWPELSGYLHVSGTTKKYYKTLIEIIPAVK